MKILHLIGAFDKKLGGTYAAIVSVMSMENNLNYTNEIISLQADGQEYDKDLFEGKLHLFKPSFPYKFSYSKPAYDWLALNLKSYNLLILHEAWGAMAIQAATLAYKMGVKYVIWPHGSLDPFDLQKKRWLKKVAGHLLISNITKRASAICCTSVKEKDVLETYNQHKDNISILPLPVNFELKGSRQRFRTKYKIENDELTFLFLSRVDYKKGLDLFLYAYKKFIENTGATHIKLVIAGKGTPAYEAFIKGLIDQLDLSSYVIISGFVTGMAKADAYAGADCFILPSMNENYGIAVIEALQSDLPVLISDNIYIWESIIPEGGWLCQHEVSSICQQIENVYKAYINNTLTEKKPQLAGESFKSTSLLQSYARFYQTLFQSELLLTSI